MFSFHLYIDISLMVRCNSSFYLFSKLFMFDNHGSFHSLKKGIPYLNKMSTVFKFLLNHTIT